MDEDSPDIFKTIFDEADKINSTLNNLHAKFISQNSTVANKVSDALKAIECALEIVVRNTDIKTNEVHKEIFENVTQESLTKQLEKIGLLSRRLEREVKTFFNSIDNK